MLEDNTCQECVLNNDSYLVNEGDFDSSKLNITGGKCLQLEVDNCVETTETDAVFSCKTCE